MSDIQAAYASYQELTKRIETQCSPTNITYHTGKICDIISRASMQLPFSPLELCQSLGELSFDVAALATHYGWEFGDMFLSPDIAGDHEPLAVSVVTNNPTCMALVLAAMVGEASILMEQENDLARLKFQFSLIITCTALLSDIHGIDYIRSCLPENIDSLKSIYPNEFDDVPAMERKPASRIVLN